MEIKCRNVNEAFRKVVETITHVGHGPQGSGLVVRRPSRNGETLTIAEPVTITYTHPRERVLFNAARDANPFLHLYESLWMLAGRNDVAPLAYYAKRMTEFSDDGKTLNGAYGYRWRNADTSGQGYYSSVDQLDLIVKHLKADPTSRRAVLSMWNVEEDLLKIGRPCTRCGYPKANERYDDCCPDGESHNNVKPSKDVCCNLSVMFAVRRNPATLTTFDPGSKTYYAPNYLDMTVTNRSNDAVWGLLGANVVHFSFLQEYVADRLGVGVGRYHHFTNNLHVYSWNWNPDEWLRSDQDVGGRDSGIACRSDLYQWREGPRDLDLVPLGAGKDGFDDAVKKFVSDHAGYSPNAQDYGQPFLDEVARPMMTAFHHYKRDDFDAALKAAANVEAEDWSIAGFNWIKRRQLKREGKTS